MVSPTATPYLIKHFLKADAPEDFERALALRFSVFVDEQAVPIKEEQDAYDAVALHWLVSDSATSNAVATGRLISYQESCQTQPVAKIGRIAVIKSARGKGLGEFIMKNILQTAYEAGYEQAILDAQVQALPFYARLGFVAEGDEFIDAGIPHFRMRVALRSCLKSP
jgi:predicted GNAT family N-acyltransferase